MKDSQERLDDIRRERSDVENHLIDELRAGKISRREFMRRGTVVGMSIPLVAFIAAACSKNNSANPNPSATGGTASSTPAIKKGGTITVSEITPSSPPNPLSTADEGGLAVLGQTGQYLTWSNANLTLEPVLATSWTPNSDASEWTFKIRQGVKFNDGSDMTVDDVVASLKAQTNPDSKVYVNASSAFVGVLTPDGISSSGTDTVVCKLEAPNGNFPYIVSSDNYNVVILPKTYDYSGDYTKSFIGTGPWKMSTYDSQTGVVFVKNPNYWETGLPYLDGFSMKFFATQDPQVLGLSQGSIDVISQFSAATGQTLLNDSSITVYALKSTAHRQVHMTVDIPPFNKPEIRQALALTLDRPSVISGLLNGKADLGNDSPFSPMYQSTDTSVAQRAQNIDQAKQLMSQAGVPNGFDVTLYGWDGFEMPQLAQLIKDAASQIGINIKLQINDASTYYSKFWLTGSSMGMTDYGHRGVPNVVLVAALTSKGPWNAAHYKDTSFDQMVTSYVGALDLDAQRTAAKQIEEKLLADTPVAFFYFYNHMSAAKPTVQGAEFTGMGHFRLTKAGLTT